LTLYAQWSANVYEVTYNGNADDAAGAVAGNEATYDESYTTSQNGFTRPGWTFSGWNTEADGTGASHAAGGAFTYQTAGDTAFYAQWTANTYTVKYDGLAGANPGSIADKTGVYWNGTAQDLTPEAPAKTGYVFTGWKVTKRGNDSVADGAVFLAADSPAYHALVGGADDAIESVTLTARWEARTVNVTYNANGGAGLADEDTSGPYGGTLTAPAADPVKDGYTFEGWYASAGFAGSKWIFGVSGTALTIANGVIGADDGPTLTLYAKWIDIPSTVYTVLEEFGTFKGAGAFSAKIDADYVKFVQLLYNGREVAPSNYTITQGSTVITLHENYLKSFANGVHWFVAVFTDGASENIRLVVEVKDSQKPVTDNDKEDGKNTSGKNTSTDNNHDSDEDEDEVAQDDAVPGGGGAEEPSVNDNAADQDEAPAEDNVVASVDEPVSDSANVPAVKDNGSGLAWWVVPLIIALGIILAAVIAIIARRRKRA
jgi:uncharacterized repeat protein (TIGR02543 family)